MAAEELQQSVDDAILDFTLGDSNAALARLEDVTRCSPTFLPAWHALAEINFQLRRLDAALHAADKACALAPDDLFIHATLSRIWAEKGDKAAAENHGAQARILTWKEQLKKPAGP